MLDLNGKLRLHDDFKAATVPIGTEREPVVVVDNFLSSPQLLTDFAAAHCAFDAVSDAFYPGTRAPAPAIYCFALRAFLAPIIAQAFGLQDSRITGELSHFSLVLTPPERLQPVQRMPHFDNTNPQTTRAAALSLRAAARRHLVLSPSAHRLRIHRRVAPFRIRQCGPRGLGRAGSAAGEIYLRRRSAL